MHDGGYRRKPRGQTFDQVVLGRQVAGVGDDIDHYLAGLFGLAKHQEAHETFVAAYVIDRDALIPDKFPYPRDDTVGGVGLEIASV